LIWFLNPCPKEKNQVCHEGLAGKKQGRFGGQALKEGYFGFLLAGKRPGGKRKGRKANSPKRREPDASHPRKKCCRRGRGLAEGDNERRHFLQEPSTLRPEEKRSRRKNRGKAKRTVSNVGIKANCEGEGEFIQYRT